MTSVPDDFNDEPVILPLHADGSPQPPPGDDREPDSEDEEQPHVESFWAGRNHAMRRSARWAA